MGKNLKFIEMWFSTNEIYLNTTLPFPCDNWGRLKKKLVWKMDWLMDGWIKYIFMNACFKSWCMSLMLFPSDSETKVNTGSPSSDTQSQDVNEDSCEAQVKDEHPAQDAIPSSPDSRRGQLLKAVLSVDSEDSCNPGSASLDFPQTPLDSPVSEPLSKWTHLTQFELSGLRTLVGKLESLPDNKKCVPEGIENPLALLEDMKVRDKTRFWDLN